MPTVTASFESPEYWEGRFKHSPESFDWLVSPTVLVDPLLAVLSRYPSQPFPSVLHIGCGTSGLSNLLRSHIPPPSILNVDFSHRAIELGIQRELKEFGDNEGSMNWATADLLDWQSVARACGLHDGYSTQHQGDSHKLDSGYSKPSGNPNGHEIPFSVVIEKSCADCIACGVDVEIPVPYCLSGSLLSGKQTVKDNAGEVFIHPVALLAIHLAAVTKPNGSWIAFSYSETRFDCLYEDEDEGFQRAREEGLVPDPAMLWKLEMKQEIVAQQEGLHDGVYRPKISHWLYILKRTEQ